MSLQKLKDIKIIEELERLAMNEEFRLNYDVEAVKRKTENSIKFESYQNGLEYVIEQGIEQGIEQRNIEIAKNLLSLGTLSIEDISKATGLDIGTLEKLSKEEKS